MKERLPTFIAILLLALLLWATWFASEYAKNAFVIAPIRQSTDAPDAHYDAVTMIISDKNGNATNRINGDKVLHFPKDNSYTVSNIYVIGQDNNNPRVIGSADQATILDNVNHIILEGNAMVSRAGSQIYKPIQINSNKLEIYPNENVIKTDELAHVKYGEKMLDGKGMEYNNKTGLLEVFNQTSVEIQNQPSKK